MDGHTITDGWPPLIIFPITLHWQIFYNKLFLRVIQFWLHKGPFLCRSLSRCGPVFDSVNAYSIYHDKKVSYYLWRAPSTSATLVECL